MLTPDNVPPVGANERLSRYILSKRHVNQQTNLLKPDPFVPHPYKELSVTRGRDATEEEIWNAGHDVARQISAKINRTLTLQGRGDALAATYHDQGLQTESNPVPGNPNHVNVTGWPSKDDKAKQKLIALEIAKVAKFVSVKDEA